MRVAIIDLGTNTFHLMLAEVSKSNYSIFFRERIPVRIGEKGINKGEITPEAWERAIHALIGFKEVIEKNQIKDVFGTATSAIRNAKNGQALVREIYTKTGIEIEIISGLREAELIHLGAKEALDLGEEMSLIMDIGGGSIEFIISNQEKVFWMESFEVGGQRLVEHFHKSDPIQTEEIEALHHYFDENLIPLKDACKKFRPETLVGCSGTFDTLSEIYCEQQGTRNALEATEYPLPIEQFNRILEELIQKTRAERLQIPGMIEMRVEMIVVASILIDYILKTLELRKIRVSAYALKEGILFNVLKRLQAE